MRTAIIDRSLAGTSFLPIVDKSDILMYTNALIEAGADYVEIDLPALVRIAYLDESVDTGDKKTLPIVLDRPEMYIFRVERPEEILVANSLPFAYAVLPLKYSHFINKIKIPVILEINTGDADVLALLRIVSENINLTHIELLRLVGDFNGDSQEEFANMLFKIRMMFAVPIDICPLNTTLGALSSAITAFDGGIDSITLCFGNSNNFCPLEEFLITLATVHKFLITRSYVSGICKAAVMSAQFSEIETTNLQMLMKRYRLTPQKVEKADDTPPQRNAYVKKAARRSLLERKLDYLEVDEGLSAEITDKLKKYGMEFYDTGRAGEYLN
ncbi:MAG: hypothetical protein FWH20_07960 [Oscillospiraceae bacterium]|nr:hypothetical protein [Oscillospiraceae bacterium]